MAPQCKGYTDDNYRCTRRTNNPYNIALQYDADGKLFLQIIDWGKGKLKSNITDDDACIDIAQALRGLYIALGNKKILRSNVKLVHEILVNLWSHYGCEQYEKNVRGRRDTRQYWDDVYEPLHKRYHGWGW
jgi:hypothetical protein